METSGIIQFAAVGSFIYFYATLVTVAVSYSVFILPKTTKEIYWYFIVLDKFKNKASDDEFHKHPGKFPLEFEDYLGISCCIISVLCFIL